jgi:ubiquinone/menaquinone biosynthesis C-methylase UbiE
MPLIDHFFAIGAIRKAIWKFWYPFLTRRLHGEEVIFLNYAFETDPPMAIPLASEDEPNRACIQLYHHVGTQVNLQGKDVLEVSCGHGGGASYLTRTQKPEKYTGLDLNASGVAFCKNRYQIRNLDFVQGDAASLPFPNASLDVVINVEASHCYPDFPQFLVEVARVLKPGGYFLYADFRFSDGIAKWEAALHMAPLKLEQMRDISPEVLRGMECNSARSMQLLDKKLPGFLQGLGRDFAGVKGSRIYNALLQGGLSYRSYCYRKALNGSGIGDGAVPLPPA